MANVLVLEGEPSIAGIVSHKLRREGHAVRCEAELPEVGRLFAGWKPDVVLLDLELDPALALLSDLAQRFPVLVLTEFRDGDTPGRALRAGAAATIEKPFKPTVLARVVARLAGAL
jgi:DNA-binding response OmpR family regulator